MATSKIQWLNTEKLTVERVNNSFVDATDFARITAYKKGGIGYINGNLHITTGGSTSDFVTIGTIEGWNACESILITVPCQGNPSVVLLTQITSNGTIQIYSSQTLVSSFYRFVVVFPLWGG